MNLFDCFGSFGLFWIFWIFCCFKTLFDVLEIVIFLFLNVDVFKVLDTFVKHAYTNGLKSCTILLGVLERHKGTYRVFHRFLGCCWMWHAVL